MTLIPIEHARSLSSPEEAERLFRALGARCVSARGFHTKDRARFTALVEAIEPEREHTLSFQRGVLDLPSLEALARAPFGYLDIRSATASYRSWPDRYTWVHAQCELGAAGEAFGAPLAHGENVFPDAKITYAASGQHYTFSLDTTSIPTALEVFGRLTDPAVVRGFISGVTLEAKPLLVAFLERLDATVDAVLDIDVASAKALAHVYSGEQHDWQGEGILVDFPEGKIHGYLTSPNIGEDAREAWRSRLDKALRRAGLL